jgi:hypothetical protein
MADVFGAEVTVINLWGHGEPVVDDCPMCERERLLSYAVGWWCGPRQEDIGSTLRNGEEVGGMTVCKDCHDQLYGIAA